MSRKERRLHGQRPAGLGHEARHDGEVVDGVRRFDHLAWRDHGVAQLEFLGQAEPASRAVDDEAPRGIEGSPWYR